MGRGRWTRWGRGWCEGWSLQIGDNFAGTVTCRRDLRSGALRWEARLGSTDLGEWPGAAEAKARVEDSLRASMARTLEDWQLYLAAHEGKTG